MKKQEIDKEKEIYDGLKDHINNAVTNLYEQYYHSTTQIIINENGTEDDRRDLFQEAITTFIRKYNTGEFIYEPGRMGGYIRTLVIGYWRNQQRKIKAVRLTETHTDQLSYEGEEQILNNLEREEKKKQFTKLIKLLSEKCKAIILGRYRNEYSDKELAIQWNYADHKSLKQGRVHCLKKLKMQIFSK